MPHKLLNPLNCSKPPNVDWYGGLFPRSSCRNSRFNIQIGIIRKKVHAKRCRQKFKTPRSCFRVSFQLWKKKPCRQYHFHKKKYAWSNLTLGVWWMSMRPLGVNDLSSLVRPPAPCTHHLSYPITCFAHLTRSYLSYLSIIHTTY